MKITSGWIPIDPDNPESFPKVGHDGYSDYILLSYENYDLIDIGMYRVEDGTGTFYPGDEARSCASFGLIVNAWMPIIEPYREEEETCQNVEPAEQT